MDSHDIFRKLCTGAKFNFKKFQSDARKLQMVKSTVPLEPEIEDVTEYLRGESIADHEANDFDAGIYDQFPKIKSEPLDDYEDIEREPELLLLGTLTSSEVHSVKKEKKKKKGKKHISAAQKAKDLKEEEIRHFRNQNRLNVVGKEIPPPVRSFASLLEDYKVSKIIISNLEKCGYQEPTPIQMQAMPIMLKQRQILACAPTGSGKTAAFLVPILNELGGPMKKGFRAVIVCPTRELARQTHRECLLLAEGTGLRIHIISKASQASTKFGPQSAHKFDLLVTTPNRLIYLLQQEPPAIELKAVQWLVVDESDKLFEAGPQGFRDQLAAIYRACDLDHTHRAMFSATHLPDVAKWARTNLKRLITVTVGQRNTASELVEQKLLYVGNEAGKLIAFRNLVRTGLTPPVLVFVQSKTRAKELFTELIYDGINVDIINADRTQMQRDNVVRCFREGKIWVLICTELMGRGIDFKGVNLVINYDFPPSSIAYIHRIGRTGRAGRRGKAVTFFTQDDTVNLRSIAQVMKDSGCEVPDYMLSIKRASKRERRKLESRAPEREQISTMPQQEKLRLERLQKRIEKTKRQKKRRSEANGTESSEMPTKPKKAKTKAK